MDIVSYVKGFEFGKTHHTKLYVVNPEYFHLTTLGLHMGLTFPDNPNDFECCDNGITLTDETELWDDVCFSHQTFAEIEIPHDANVCLYYIKKNSPVMLFADRVHVVAFHQINKVLKAMDDETLSRVLSNRSHLLPFISDRYALSRLHQDLLSESVRNEVKTKIWNLKKK